MILPNVNPKIKKFFHLPQKSYTNKIPISLKRVEHWRAEIHQGSLDYLPKKLGTIFMINTNLKFKMVCWISWKKLNQITELFLFFFL